MEPPTGEISEHPGDLNRFRITSEEKRAQDRLMDTSIRHIRLASECHRQVRKWAQTFIQPGIKIIDMCEAIEERNRMLVKENGLHAGVRFGIVVETENCNRLTLLLFARRLVFPLDVLSIMVYFNILLIV